MIKFLFMVIYITYENENVSEVFFLYLYLYGMVWYDMIWYGKLVTVRRFTFGLHERADGRTYVRMYGRLMTSWL